MKRAEQSQKQGFTLVEVLLSLTLLAGLMTAMSQVIYSLAEVWTKNQAQFVFARHARAVTHHVETLLQTAAGAAHASEAGQGEPRAQEVRLPGGEQSVLLSFELPAGDRLLAGPDMPSCEVSCALAWRKDEGLVLYWKSRLEADFDDAPLHKTVVSPLVTRLAYDCFDATTRQWSEVEVLQKDGRGEWPAPRRLRLRFIRDGREQEMCIALPGRGEGVPAY